jgi:hypothetical protein
VARIDEDIDDLVKFELVSGDEGSVSIVLANRASTLKGVRLVVTVEGGTLVRVERGSLFSGVGGFFFGLVPTAPPALSACVSLWREWFGWESGDGCCAPWRCSASPLWCTANRFQRSRRPKSMRT